MCKFKLLIDISKYCLKKSESVGRLGHSYSVGSCLLFGQIPLYEEIRFKDYTVSSLLFLPTYYFEKI